MYRTSRGEPMRVELTSLMELLQETGLDDEQVVPMPCCDLPVKLGDVEFGTERVCQLGNCMEWICECGNPWGGVLMAGCLCKDLERA